MEMILKLLVLGFKVYLSNRWNIFDGIVVIISVVDFIVVQTQGTEATGTSVLRTFRLVSNHSRLMVLTERDALIIIAGFFSNSIFHFFRSFEYSN